MPTSIKTPLSALAVGMLLCFVSGPLRLIGKARESGKIVALPVVPGCDTSLCYPDKDPIKIKRNNGDYYRKVWDETVALNPDWITVNSFNEWPEGSEIEPSRECGDLYLKLTKEYAEKFRARKKAGSVAAPKQAGAEPSPGPRPR